MPRRSFEKCFDSFHNFINLVNFDFAKNVFATPTQTAQPVTPTLLNHFSIFFHKARPHF